MPNRNRKIPGELLDQVWRAFDPNQYPRGARGRWSDFGRLATALRDYLKAHKDTLPTLYGKYGSGISVDMLKRAFNKKRPDGANKDLRDFLCLFATGKKWKQFVLERFPDRVDEYLDGTENGIQISGRNLRILNTRVPEPERTVIKRQLGEATHAPLASPSNKITIPSEDDPTKPEFPPLPFYKPKFPATETVRINIPGYTDTWLKDESTNPTGTHKDRMAWEIVILAEKYNIPEMSLISSGSAACAIQHFFNLFGIPTTLKVLVDSRTSDEVKAALRGLGCHLFESDLSDKLLLPEEIRRLTHNTTGIDITYRETMDYSLVRYYDWLSFEILNENPDYCFIPFGTGDLFINVLKILEREFNARRVRHDPRFRGNTRTLVGCNFIGATTSRSDSKLDKLYSHFLPSRRHYENFIRRLKLTKTIGTKSGVRDVEEGFVEQALDIARSQGIKCEPSGIAGLALLLQMSGEVPRDAKILIVNTGCTNYFPLSPAIQAL